eukprot:356972-Chlamydomonas_euryale.AAC.4
MGLMTRLALAEAGELGIAVDPDLGLVNGAPCNAHGLAAEDMEVIASGKASVAVTMCACADAHPAGRNVVASTPLTHRVM